MRKLLFFVTMTIFLASSSFAMGSADIQAFTVPAGQQTTKQVDLNEGDTVLGTIVVLGGVTSDVNFIVSDPNGITVLNDQHITAISFSFSATLAGSYVMHFDNSFSTSTNKTVNVNYYIEPSVFTIPANTFLLIVLIIIGLVVIGAIAAALFTRIRHHH